VSAWVIRETEITGRGQILQLISLDDCCRDGSFSGDILREAYLLKCARKEGTTFQNTTV